MRVASEGWSPGFGGVSVRRMVAADVPEVAEIERRSSVCPWGASSFQRELENPVARVLVAQAQDGRVVGFVCSWCVAGELHVLNLAVEPEHRRRGVGRALVESVVAAARAAGADTAVLEVRRGNHAAQSLYGKLGFEEAGVRLRYYADGEDALVMVCSLGRTGLPGARPRS